MLRGEDRSSMKEVAIDWEVWEKKLEKNDVYAKKD